MTFYFVCMRCIRTNIHLDCVVIIFKYIVESYLLSIGMARSATEACISAIFPGLALH
jgi:hypothetical protein